MGADRRKGDFLATFVIFSPFLHLGIALLNSTIVYILLSSVCYLKGYE